MSNLVYIIKTEIGTVFTKVDGHLYAAPLKQDGTAPEWNDGESYSGEITGYEIGDLNYSRLMDAFNSIECLDY